MNERQLPPWHLHLLCARPAQGSEQLGSCVVSPQVLPLEALVTDAGEVTEAGKAYVPPRVLQEALCIISGVPGLEDDVANTEQLAQEMLIISHHPSLGACLGRVLEGRGLCCRSRPGRRPQRAPLPFSGCAIWPVASTSCQDEDRSGSLHYQAPGSDHSQDHHTEPPEPGNWRVSWFWSQVRVQTGEIQRNR